MHDNVITLINNTLSSTFNYAALLPFNGTLAGFAPMDVQARGLGPVLVARTDSRDFTLEDMGILHDYMCHLIDMWGNWLEQGANQERVRALTPAAFHRFTEGRRGC